MKKSRDSSGKFRGKGKVTKLCIICGIPFESYISANNKSCSRKCHLVRIHAPEVYKKIGLAQVGRPSPNKGIPMSEAQKQNLSRLAKERGAIPPSQWKGDDITYNSLHWWLRREYGSADHCEAIDCDGKSKKYEWALIKGKEYERKRVNFMQLCKSCHVKYDMNEQWQSKVIKNLTSFTPYVQYH